jgi:hypothetical protein
MTFLHYKNISVFIRRYVPCLQRLDMSLVALSLDSGKKKKYQRLEIWYKKNSNKMLITVDIK